MSGPPQSALFDTGVRDLGKVAAAGNLGNEYQRKNRGRYQSILTGQGAVRLVDVVGDDQLATQTTITCSLESALGSRADNASASDLPEVLGVIHWGTDGAAHTWWSSPQPVRRPWPCRRRSVWTRSRRWN